MNSRWLMIKQLDKQLKEWQSVSNKYGRPRAGWVKTLREALCMSIEQFAGRLGLSRSRITQLENAEIHDAVTLRSLREAANALECEFVYAIIPKKNHTLESIIKTRAEQVAKERVARVAHSMSLEAQSVDADALKIQKDDLTKILMQHLNKTIWATLDDRDEKAMDIKELFKNGKNQENTNPEYANKLKENPIRIEKNNDYKQNDLLKKLIENLKKKK